MITAARIEAHAAVVLGALERKPDITLADLRDELAGAASPSAACGASSSTGGSRFRKTRHAAEQDRPEVPSRREAWFEGQLDLDPHTVKPGITLAEFSEELVSRGIQSSCLTTIWSTLRRLGLSHKKEH